MTPLKPALRATILSLTALTALAGAANAHDTWFDRPARAASAPGSTELLMNLGTGNRFPVHEFSIDARSVQASGCRQAGQAVPLVPMSVMGKSLLMRANPPTTGPTSCWAQLAPFEVSLSNDLVEVYLAEANPPASVRDAWKALRAKGLPWKERYVKHARIELGTDAPASDATADGASARATVAAAEMPLDMLMQRPAGGVRAGQPVTVQVVRDRKPLPRFAVELVARDGSVARWLETDANGHVTLDIPTPGTWQLRGIDIRRSVPRPNTWDTRFVTLVFNAHAADAGAPASTATGTDQRP